MIRNIEKSKNKNSFVIRLALSWTRFKFKLYRFCYKPVLIPLIGRLDYCFNKIVSQYKLKLQKKTKITKKKINIESNENAEYYNQYEELYDLTSEGNTSTNSILDDQLTQTSEGNTSTNSSKNTRKPSPLWLYFSFNPTYPNIPICDKCIQKFLPKSGNSSLERHLSSQHNIIVPKIKCYQTKLPFVTHNPWPEAQKKERDLALITWIIIDQQPFCVVENNKFLELINILDHATKSLNVIRLRIWLLAILMSKVQK
ncbi:hypothetical protein C2G38_2180902 [Gigaspora rosea]|uniref:BED-type domain-containing protein n=1 Tax=Gigaspora rosea TaxID=44941 RepID=A0A397VKU3_9GLOM|nr:hypothetical protein C2G38_2180902 [Gigaspora rosea]